MKVTTTITNDIKVGQVAVCTDCGQLEEIVEVTDTQVWTYEEGDSYEFEGHACCFACTEFRKEEERILMANAICEYKALIELSASE
jgi:hypothetical protein